VVAATFVVTGCDVFDAKLLPSGPATTSDGRPPRPDIADSGSDPGELVFRIDDVLLNSSVDWGTVGRNLDGFVTTADAPDRQCTAPSEGPPPVDGPGGVDNAMGAQLLSVIELVVPCLEGQVGNSHTAGRGTLMLWVQGWNGEANDSLVSVSMLVAADATSAPTSDVTWDEEGHRLVLASDGITDAPDPTGAETDSFYIRPDSFSGGGMPIPRLRDVNAYIADGVIVYGLPDRGAIPLNAGIGSLTILVTDGLMLMDMNDTFDAIDEGELSGRFSLTDLLDAGESIGVCEASRTQVEAQFNRILDVMSNPNTPADRALECDAMSLGIPFTGSLATLPRVSGQPVRAGSNPPLPNACEIGGNPCAAP
jgi:hypothetical protein